LGCESGRRILAYAVIIAGGSGKRLWPLSRQSRPKQVLRLFEGKTLLRLCFDRLRGIFDVGNILVLTNAQYAQQVREDLAELPAENIIAEPQVRDTAGAIGLAATALSVRDRQCTMAVVTADQVIEPDQPFIKAMRKAIEFVEKNPDALITFGIEPTYAATQYGYIKMGKPCAADKGCETVCSVAGFKEKPDADTAAEYIKSGDYCWNSGMFVWRAATILEHLKRFLPGCAEPLEKIRTAWGGPEQARTLEEWFVRIPKASIDYAVMEKAANVYCIRLDCRWLDLGSFTALADIITSDKNGNIVVAGHSELLDCKNSIVATEDNGHLIALIGAENMIVAHSPDATLVCPIEQSHRLKELLEQIEKNKGKRFL